jgi:divalent metal cation (Fe/Co/Zn/Cd) transporter
VRLFVFLHVLTMFTAVAMTIGVPTLLRSIAKSGDVPAIRRSFALAQPFIKAIPALFTVGAALGIVAIFTNNFDPFAPFLLIAYALFILATVVGIVITDPWYKSVTKLSSESPDEAPSTELSAVLRDPRMNWADWFDRIIILVFIFDMVVKPFS